MKRRERTAPPSLRRTLTLYLGVLLGVFAVALLFAARDYGQRAANRSYDHLLVSSALSIADSVALVKRLSNFFSYQIADLGGFTTLDFIAQTVQEADKTWIVCDQSIGAIVSTASLLRDLEARGLEPQRFSLVVNKIDPAVGLSARDIAARLRLPLAHVLPMRRTALLNAASRGTMLARESRSDPYVQAVLGMTRGLQREYGSGAGATPAGRLSWSTLMTQFTGKRRSARES